MQYIETHTITLIHIIKINLHLITYFTYNNYIVTIYIYTYQIHTNNNLTSHSGDILYDLAHKDFNLEDLRTPMEVLFMTCTPHGLFMGFKRDQDEHLKKEDLHFAIEGCLRIPIRDDMLHKLLMECSPNRSDGHIEQDSFVEFLNKREGSLRILFDAIDANHDGSISLTELHNYLHDTSYEGSICWTPMFWPCWKGWTVLRGTRMAASSSRSSGLI